MRGARGRSCHAPGVGSPHRTKEAAGRVGCGCEWRRDIDSQQEAAAPHARQGRLEVGPRPGAGVITLCGGRQGAAVHFTAPQNFKATVCWPPPQHAEQPHLSVITLSRLAGVQADHSSSEASG